MKAKLLQDIKLLDTNIILKKEKTYPDIHASNLPDNKTKYFIADVLLDLKDGEFKLIK